MAFFDFIWSFWNAMFHLIWFGKKSLSNKLNIYIKSTNGSTVSVNLDPKWDIKNVKEMIAPKLGMPPEEVKIILAGKELDDSTVIEECDLGERSILHAVRSLTRNRGEGSKPLNEMLSDLSFAEDNEVEEEEVVLEGPSAPKARAHFYVYCTSPCDSMKEGKLRVRCSKCKSGAITVDSDPASWSHVLEPNKISGRCEAENCPDGAVAWAEFYFKCSEHTSTGEQDEAVPLHLIRTNYKSVPCLACMDVCETVVVFSCSHVACIPCFTQYCVTRLRERQFTSDAALGYTLPCPANCQNSLITEPHHFKLLPPNMYQQYQRFGAEEFVLKSGGVLCPQPGCGAGILPDSECLNRVTCLNGCGFVFCRHCLQGYHLGDCEMPEESTPATSDGYTVAPSQAAKSRWDEASRVIIKVTTKPCPKCRTATERAEGCMHMVCTRCSYEWCWVCQIGWARECMSDHWFG